MQSFFSRFRLGVVLAMSLALACSSCTATRLRPAEEPLRSAVSRLAPDSSAQLPAHLEPVATKRPCWLNPFCRAGAITKTTKVKNSILIIQHGTGHTAAAAAKPATMATGPAATAVEATKAVAPVQTGAGNLATDNTKVGQKGGAAATGNGSAATATTKKGGVPFWGYLLGASILFAGGLYVGVNFAPQLAWLRRGARLVSLAGLCLLASSCAGTRYSYKEARATARWHAHMVRHYRHQNNREFRHQRRQHQQQLQQIRQQRQRFLANL